METIEKYQKEFSIYLKENIDKQEEPKTLYEPIDYILNIGGKRIRPSLVLLATDIFGGNYKKAMDAALAVEMFHNFSLMHDDIMDESSLRRGRETVHKKWDINTAILSGDAMQILAYQYFERYEQHTFKELAMIFSRTALQVCQGQQYDLDFEKQEIVCPKQYYKMIECKTAVLLGAALRMGGVVAGTSEKNKDMIYDFGINLGMAFQLQDDYLDTFGDQTTFGKRIGGDILENKKTILYIRALETLEAEEKQRLLTLYSQKNEDEEQKIEQVRKLFEKAGSNVFLQQEIRRFTKQAFEILDKMEIPNKGKDILKKFGTELMNRKI